MRRWWQNRGESRRAGSVAEFQRRTYAGSVLMTQAQALTAATWAVRGGEEPPPMDADLKALFLANTIALGFGPRTLNHQDRAIWHLLAQELRVAPVANYPTVADVPVQISEYLAQGISVPGYEFWATIGVSDQDLDLFSRELLHLSSTKPDDMAVVYLEHLCSYFGAKQSSELRTSFTTLILHAGFTLMTVSQDTSSASEDEQNQRLDLACAFEGRMLALAKRMRDVTEYVKSKGGYSFHGD